MSDLLPVSPAIISTPGRLLLLVGLLAIVVSAGAMLRVHHAQYEIAAMRASRIAGLGVIVALAALGGAFLAGAA